MIELLHMDCMIYMATLKDKAFDLAICDPPFGIGNFVQSTGTVRGDAVEWNNHIPNNLYFSLLKKVSKHQIIFGANYFNQFDEKGGAIIWIKNQPMPNFSKAVIASCSLHKKIELYTQTWTNFVHNGRVGIHECEMPVALYKWLLKNYAKPGDKILDTHLGSASSAIAAHQMGFDFVGTEIDREYYESALKRYVEAIKQQTLFDYKHE